MGNGQYLREAINEGAPPAPALPNPRAQGRRQRRAAETRLRLFRCALQLFAERGISNVTVEEITEAADVGKGTFFNYFESKDHVLGVLAEIQLGKVRQAVIEAQKNKESIRAVLRRFALRITEEPGRSPCLARAMVSSFLASESLRAIIAGFMQEGRSIISQVVVAGQERGEIDPRLKPEQVALQLQQTFMGTMLLWSLRGGPELRVCIENSFKHFWRAVAVSGKKLES